MIRPLLLVYSLFSICTFLMCTAGNPGSWSDNDKVSTLNDILKTKGWKRLVTLDPDREFKSINGEAMDVSDLLDKGADGNIVTPANYTDKLVRSSTVGNCIYSESLKFINDLFIEMIAGKCMSMGSSELMLDCIERFWEKMDVIKSLIEKMLVALNFFHNSSKTLCTRTVIDALESLLPHCDRQKYIKSNYLDDNGTVKIDNFKSDHEFLLDKMICANKILRDFLVAFCWPTGKGKNEKSDEIIEVEKVLDSLQSHQVINELFEIYFETLHEVEEMFINELGFNKEEFRV